MKIPTAYPLGPGIRNLIPGETVPKHLRKYAEEKESRALQSPPAKVE